MKKDRKLVLQVGESTHTHTLEAEEGIAWEQGNSGPSSFHFVIDREGTLRHEEHGPMKLPKGNFFKYPQVEYDPMSRDIREVFD